MWNVKEKSTFVRMEWSAGDGKHGVPDSQHQNRPVKNVGRSGRQYRWQGDETGTTLVGKSMCSKEIDGLRIILCEKCRLIVLLIHKE